MAEPSTASERATRAYVDVFTTAAAARSLVEFLLLLILFLKTRTRTHAHKYKLSYITHVFDKFLCDTKKRVNGSVK